MTDILSFINEKYQGKYRYLRLGNVRISVEERKANVTFLVPEDIYDYHLKGEDFNEIKAAVKEALGGYTVYCKLEKIILTEESVISALAEYLTKYFPLVAANSDFSKIKVAFGQTLSISITVPENLRDYMDRISFNQKVKEYFLSKYAAEIDLSFVFTDDAESIVPSTRQVQSGRYGKSVTVTDKTLVMGKLSDLHSAAVHISTLKGEGEEAVCCGKISYLSFKTRDESKRDTYKKFFKHYYTFSISDTTGYLNIFINTDDEYPLLQNGAEVICKGRVNARDESSNLSMYVKSLAICKIPFATIEEQTKPLDPPESYSILMPKEYHEVVYDQMGFDFFGNQTRKTDTGANGIVLVLHSLKTERAFVPYEIAMCKIESGKITEYLHTYLKVAFTEETERAIFANQKGYSSPRLSTVIPDLVKFTAGHLIVGTNPSSALDLLNVTAKPLRYLFSNDVHVVQPPAKGEGVKKGDALEETAVERLRDDVVSAELERLVRVEGLHVVGHGLAREGGERVRGGNLHIYINS